WPAMLRVIGQVQPAFVIAENVDGILSMVQPGRTTELEGSSTLFGSGDHVYRTEERYVADLVCADLEKAGYAVQPIVIPACGVGAPHRRYRVWFVAQRLGGRYSPHPCDTGTESMQKWQTAVHAAEPATHAACCGDFAHKTNSPIERERRKDDGQQSQRRVPPQRTDGLPPLSRSLADTECGRGNELDTNIQPQQPDGARVDGTGGQRFATFANEQGRVPRRTDHAGTEEPQSAKGQLGRADCPQDWWRGFPSVSPVCDRDDGLSVGIPSLTIPFGEWRKNAITALGNSMVPQVVMELFRAIEVELNKI
ncbi:MAG: DNA cytosine methyltransferase, partial [Prevotella sp.]